MKTKSLKTKAMSILLALVMLLGMLPVSVFAADSTPSYVALGDSISTGYGLTTPTSEGFTYLLADDLGYELTNLAVDGNTAAGVLAQLQNDAVKTAVTNADLITITAGGNDLMALLYQAIADQYNSTQADEANHITAAQVPGLLTGSDVFKQLTLMNIALGLLNPEDTENYLIDDPEFTEAVAAYISVLNQVTAGILAVNSDATIIVATQYNPYVDFKGAKYSTFGTDLNPIYAGMEAGATALNTAIKNNAATGKYIVADVKAAFDAYTGTGDLYNADPTSLNIDFHPTAAGHAIIAETFAAAVPAALPEVYVGGIGMADGTYLANGATFPTTTAPASGGYAHYKDGTLTLSNYAYEGAGYAYDTDYSAVIYSPTALEIVLEGQSSITNTETYGDGITVEADLTISGSGSMDITARFGIYVSGGDITVSGGNIDITADYGIYAENYITVSGGTLDIAAECGISSDGTVTFSGGTAIIDARGGDYTVSATDSIICNDGIEILEPAGAEIITDEYGYKFISDSDGDTAIYAVIGASGTTPPPAPELAIYVGGVAMTDGTYLANGADAVTTTAPATGGYAYYKDGTLTLNNYSYSGAGYSYEGYTSVIYSPDALTIVLQGENSIINTENFGDGITLESGATITGNGSIDITSFFGIYVWDDALKIDSGSIDITAKSGIVCEEGSIYFNGGTTTIDATEGYNTVSATGGIIFKDGMEILEPADTEIEIDEHDYKVIYDSKGNTDIKVVIGTKSTASEALTGTVTITGDMQVGSTLTATVTDSNNTGELSYQWWRRVETKTAIAGATSSTYTLTADDIGYIIYCVVSSSVQTGSIQGDASGTVKPAPYTVEAVCDQLWGTVTGSGSYEEGAAVTLTATPTDSTKFEYWLDTSVPLSNEPTEAELRAAIVSYDATYAFTATKNVSFEAVFSLSDEIGITPMLIAGTDEKSLLEAKWMDVEYDFGTITPGAEPITLPGEVIDKIVTIGDKQYRFAGFIFYGYDEATETDTAELKETLTIGAMPLYGSVEYWQWLDPISDGLFAAYMPYTPENPNNPQNPANPGNPGNPQNPSTPPTGDNSHLALWFALLLLSAGAVVTLVVYNRKRRNTMN